MPEDDKEKAEKLAAAKKRYEQIKKQKGKKPPTKSTAESTAPEAEEKAKDADASAAEKAEEDAPEESGELETSPPPTKTRPHGRQPSISLQSKMRSESFRKSSGPLSPALKSPTLALSNPEGADISKAELARKVKDLEKTISEEQASRNVAEERVEQLEDELEKLRSGQATNSETKRLEEEMDQLKAELRAAQRHNAQLQSAASKRRETGSPGTSAAADLEAQLQSKSNTIESLELELSKQQNQLTTLQFVNDTHTTRISTLESLLQKADHSAASSAQELRDLKANLERASERAVAEGSSRSSAETRLAQLEAELGSAQRAADEATRRADTLEKKVAALAQLRREADARSAGTAGETARLERSAAALRAENAALREEARRRRLDAAGDDAGLEELEDEERRRAAARVRELEAEVFELRRGAWRDRRRDLQPGLDEGAAGAAPFDDVDLSAAAGASPYRAPRTGGSTFSDVISSGISAFTGGTRRASGGRQTLPPRKQSLGLMSDDEFDFDPEAFRLAQEEEQRKRVERIREVKRGLTKWKDFRLDLVDIRRPMGGVFEV